MPVTDIVVMVYLTCSGFAWTTHTRITGVRIGRYISEVYSLLLLFYCTFGFTNFYANNVLLRLEGKAAYGSRCYLTRYSIVSENTAECYYSNLNEVNIITL